LATSSGTDSINTTRVELCSAREYRRVYLFMAELLAVGKVATLNSRKNRAEWAVCSATFPRTIAEARSSDAE